MRRAWLRWLPLAAILGLAAALRLHALGEEGLWLDEAMTAEAVRKVPSAMLRFLAADSQFPLFFLIEKAFCGLFGHGEFALRLPSAIFGLLAVLAICDLGRILVSQRVGLAAALFLSVNPFAIHYSQEARPYALFLLAILLSTSAWVRLCRRTTPGAAASYVASMTAALYTIPVAALLWIPHGLGLLLLRRDPGFPAAREHPRRVAAVGALPLALLLPLAGTVVQQIAAKMEGTATASWIRPPAIDAMRSAVRQYFMSGALANAALGILAVALLLAWRRAPEARPRRLLLLSLAAAFLPVLWILSHLVTPLFVERYTIGALPPAMLGLGWALLGVRPRAAAWCAVIAWAALSAIPLAGYYGGVDKDPWRETAAMLRARVAPGDVVLVECRIGPQALLHYFEPPPGVVVEGLRADGSPPTELSARRVWLVEGYGGKEERRARIRATLEGRYRRAEPIRVLDGMRRNPRAFHVADLRIVPYE